MKKKQWCISAKEIEQALKKISKSKKKSLKFLKLIGIKIKRKKKK